MINYSFIIPHKNCPDLLKRCVESIPQREDVQIIVVDDNSEEGKKPALPYRSGLEVVQLDADHSKGAGAARNEGLKRAKGKWLLFADADDFFGTGLSNTLDSVLQSESDLVFYYVSGVDSDSLQPTRRGEGYNNLVNNYLNSYFLSGDELRFFHFVPWGKIIKKSVVDENNITFEEIRYSNDMLFACKVGFYAKTIEAIPHELYIVTDRPGSLVKQVSVESRECRLGAGFRRCKFLYDNRRWTALVTYHRILILFGRLYGREGIKRFGTIMRENGLRWRHLIWFEVLSLTVRYSKNIVRAIQRLYKKKVKYAPNIIYRNYIL